MSRVFPLLFLLAGCGVGLSDVYQQCDLEIVLAPDTAAPGARVVATGGPFSEPYDTTVTVAGLVADDLEIERIDCDTCDECREGAECLSCGTCVACVEECAPCVETLAFSVPTGAPPGATTVAVLNAFGGSDAIPFTVLAAPDTGDTAPVDTGMHTGDTAGGHTGDTAASDTGDTAASHTGDTAAPHTGDTAAPHTGDTSAPHTGDTGAPTLDTGPSHTGDTGALTGT